MSEPAALRRPRPRRPVTGSAFDEVKPHLRGWLHLAMAPLALVAGLVLVTLAPPGMPRLAAAVFALTAVVLFGVSAAYHRGPWGHSTKTLLKRWDHANIFLIIAGTYTPMALVLPRRAAVLMLSVVWTGAILGVLFRVFWITAPRWLYTPLYVALGWVASFFVPALLRGGGWPMTILLLVGGVLYTAGAVAYALKRPNPAPRWFGFHEVFHLATVAAFICHYVAASFAVYG